MLCLWCKYLYIWIYNRFTAAKKTIYLPIGCFAEKISSFARTKIIQLIFFYFFEFDTISFNEKPHRNLFCWFVFKKTCSSNSSTEESAKPRVLRFTWSMKTTSPLMPDQIMQKIREVLDQNNCDYEQRER